MGVAGRPGMGMFQNLRFYGNPRCNGPRHERRGPRSLPRGVRVLRLREWGENGRSGFSPHAHKRRECRDGPKGLGSGGRFHRRREPRVFPFQNQYGENPVPPRCFSCMVLESMGLGTEGTSPKGGESPVPQSTIADLQTRGLKGLSPLQSPVSRGGV